MMAWTKRFTAANQKLEQSNIKLYWLAYLVNFHKYYVFLIQFEKGYQQKSIVMM